MAIFTPSQLTSASNATYFDNTTGSITPTTVRSLNDNWISSSILVSQTSSLSVATASNTPNAIITASAVGTTITFTKGNNTTFDIQISQTGSVATASYALFAVTASYVANAISASRATSAANADTASSAPSYLLTASYNTDSSSLSTRTTNLESTASTLTTASASFALVSASFSSTSGSLSTRTTNLESTSSTLTTASASFASSINSIQGKTGSYATTGSNTFTGTNSFNIISASFASVLSASIDYLYVQYETASVIYSSGSNQFGDAANDTQTLWGTVNVVTGPLLVTGSARVTGSLTMVGLSPVSVSHVKANDVQGVEILTNSNVTVATFGAGGGTGVTVVGQVNAASFAGSGSGVIGVVTSSLPLRGVTNIVQQVTPFIYNVQYGDGSGYNLTMSALSSSYAITAGSASYAVTSSLALTNIYTASVSNNTITFTEGDGTTFNLTVATGSGTNTVSASFATTASFAISASFASTASFLNSLNQSVTLTGSFNITGSSTFSGSVNGLVVSQSIASQTSSLDFGSANFFTSAVSASTFFNITNPKAGETVNLLLTTVGVATASFSSNVKQVSGSRYTPTSGSGKNDIITFISWDGTSVYLANVKNLV